MFEIDTIVFDRVDVIRSEDPNLFITNELIMRANRIGLDGRKVVKIEVVGNNYSTTGYLEILIKSEKINE